MPLYNPPAAASSGVAFRHGIRPSLFQSIVPQARATAALTGVLQGASIPGVPVWIEDADAFDTLTVRITTAETGIAVEAIVFSSSADGKPFTRVGLFGGTTGGAAGNLTLTLSSGGSLTPGLHWVYVRHAAATTLRLMGCAPSLLQMVGSSNPSATPGHTLTLWEPDLGAIGSPPANTSGLTISFSDVGVGAPWFALRRGT